MTFRLMDCETEIPEITGSGRQTFSQSQTADEADQQASAMRGQDGFSLIEMLICTLALTMIVGTVLSLSNMGHSRQDFEQELVSVQQNLRETSDQMYLDGFPQQGYYAASLGWTSGNSNKIASGFTTISSNQVVFRVRSIMTTSSKLWNIV